MLKLPTLQLELDAALSRIMPQQLTKYFYCNSGSEAVDNAVKIARAATGRECIIAFDVSGPACARLTNRGSSSSLYEGWVHLARFQLLI